MIIIQFMSKVFVHAPFKSDLGHPIIRIHYDLMKELKLEDDDFVVITKGKIQLIAKAFTMKLCDKHSIRLDYPFIKALNITFGDSVEIVKAT